jgi:hypothetical protein
MTNKQQRKLTFQALALGRKHTKPHPRIVVTRAYSKSEYPKGRSNGKRTTKDYFGFLLLYHDYNGLVYDYN